MPIIKTSTTYADYWDVDGDAVYDPSSGDYPVVGIRGCNDGPIIPDEFMWFSFHASKLAAAAGGDLACAKRLVKAIFACFCPLLQNNHIMVATTLMER